MKVINTWIFNDRNGKHQSLYECENGYFYCTTNGAFGQRDTSIVRIGVEEAAKIIDTKP